MATPRAPDKQIRLPSLDGRIRVTLKDKLGFVPICLVVLLAEEEDRMSFWKGTGSLFLLSCGYRKILMMASDSGDDEVQRWKFVPDNHTLKTIRYEK